MDCYVGIDLHREYFTYHATNKEGKALLRGRLVNSLTSVRKLVNSFPIPPKVVVEATRNWMWLIEALREKGCEVVLAHPLKTKAIASARIKTDTLDAQTLCHLLRSNLIPQSYMAKREEQEARELSRGRVSLVHDQTLLKNRIHALLGKENLKFAGSDLFGVKGQAWLKKQTLSEGRREMLEIYLKRLKETKRAVEKVEKLIKEKSRSLPQVKLLTTIPGIGITTAFLLAAEIGDVRRFPTSKQFASYFGLVPRLNQSGNHKYYGRITKLGNPHVRWSLVQTAHRLARSQGKFKRFVARISYRGGRKKAIVALARKLSTIIFCVLKEERPYIRDYQRLRVRPAILPERVSLKGKTALV